MDVSQQTPHSLSYIVCPALSARLNLLIGVPAKCWYRVLASSRLCCIIITIIFWCSFSLSLSVCFVSDHHSWSTCLGHHSVGAINENGFLKIQEFCVHNHMCIIQHLISNETSSRRNMTIQIGAQKLPGFYTCTRIIPEPN